jgi:hypothetical protein
MKTVLLIFILVSTLFAKDIEADYKITFGIFGQIGIAKTSLHVEGKRYKITLYAKSTGFASFISGNRQEWYESIGKIEDGRLLPDSYKKIVQREVSVSNATEMDSKTEIKRYILIYKFNHKNKEIYSTKIKIRGKSRSEDTQRVKFYTKDDLLSLFFNFKKLFPTLDIKKHYTLHAVGANKDNGKIDLLPLKKGDFKRLISGDLSKLKLMKVILSDKIFASKKGELYLGLDKNGLCEKAVLKDVILFGDIRGELIEKSHK